VAAVEAACDRLAMRIFAVALLIAALGCSKSKPATTPTPTPDPAVTSPTTDPAAPPSATPSDAELDVMFNETLTFMDALATAIDSNKSDCAAMAKGIDGVLDSHRALLTKAKSLEGNQEVDAKADAFMEAHKEEVGASTGRMMGGMQACGQDPAVQASMQRFDTM